MTEVTFSTNYPLMLWIFWCVSVCLLERDAQTLLDLIREAAGKISVLNNVTLLFVFLSWKELIKEADHVNFDLTMQESASVFLSVCLAASVIW